jgi:hypothetical protein
MMNFNVFKQILGLKNPTAEFWGEEGGSATCTGGAFTGV